MPSSRSTRSPRSTAITTESYRSVVTLDRSRGQSGRRSPPSPTSGSGQFATACVATCPQPGSRTREASAFVDEGDDVLLEGVELLEVLGEGAAAELHVESVGAGGPGLPHVLGQRFGTDDLRRR